MERFCVDCRYFQKNHHEPAICRRYVTYTVSAVHGMIPHYEECEQAREPGGKCGPEGFGWKKQNSIIKILKEIVT